jgi:hypothetical protein
VLLLLAAVPGLSQNKNGVPIQITRGETTSFTASTVGGDPVSPIEIDIGLSFDPDFGDGFDADTANGTAVNRSIARSVGAGVHASGKGIAKSNPELAFSIDGLNFFQQRFANGGNQFSVEPPDQGLCAGNGFVLESANDVLRVYDSAGNALSGVVDLNTFNGYAAAINRAVSPLRFGPSVTDPSCYYDADTQRWFHVVLSLDRANPTTQSLSGANHLDIAVSTTSSPLDPWVVYRVPVQNDGTQGTPDHHCIARVSGANVHGPCLGDYPHIGADANGFYITTNEFNLAANGFHGAQIYAFDKKALAANATTINGVLFDTTDPSLGVQLEGAPGFTVWPAQSPAGIYDSDNNGTEFFLSSFAVFTETGLDSRLLVWSMTNTQSLATTPALTLNMRVASVIPYAVPGSSVQKSGATPLKDCIADAACAPLVGATVRTNNLARVPNNDSRMQQVSYANGKLWGSLDTGLIFDGFSTPVAGIAYFVLNPNSLKVFQQGYVGVPNNYASYPALAVNASGRGVLAFTLLGADHFPSAAYTSIDAKLGAGDVHVVAEGAGPQDGFSGYAPLSNPIRPRWGDYGAAAADGNSIWIASEYISQTCSFTDYKVNTSASPFGTCNMTRGSLGNWGTRVSRLTVGD